MSDFNQIEPTTITHSEAETRALGARFASSLQAGAVVALYGTLGAGKTQFVKGICSAWGIPEKYVHSPTFTLVNEYEGHSFPVYHFDAYRIEQVSEFFELGYEDYFYGEGVCLVEWPARVEPLLPKDTVRIRFSHISDTVREISFVDEKASLT